MSGTWTVWKSKICHSSHVCGTGHRHLPSWVSTAKKGLVGSKLFPVTIPHEPGMQGANPFATSGFVQQFILLKPQPNLTASTGPAVMFTSEMSTITDRLPTTDTGTPCQASCLPIWPVVLRMGPGRPPSAGISQKYGPFLLVWRQLRQEQSALLPVHTCGDIECESSTGAMMGGQRSLGLATGLAEH